MECAERRKKIADILRNSDKPVSGTKLGELTGVSRQIIVSDINALKNSGFGIISTARGYVLERMPRGHRYKRMVKVYHTEERLLEELYIMVDNGAEVDEVIVNHKTYGIIRASLGVKCRRDADKFKERIDSGKSTPLSGVTSGYHFHTLTSESVENLDIVCKKLEEAGFISPLTEYEKETMMEMLGD